MVYLFNSGYRSGYQINLLNTLSYPNGWINYYRYTFTNTEQYVDPGLVNDYLSMVDEPALIVAIDRFATNGYVYHPIRKGLIKSCYQDGDRLIFNVELKEYIYPINNTAFNQDLITSFPDLPRLTNNDPQSRNDGHYAVTGSDLIGDSGKFKIGVPAWDNMTDQLAATSTYSAKANDETVFTRLSLDLSPTIIKSETDDRINFSSLYKLRKGKTYKVAFSFKYPGQQGNASVMLNLSGKDSLRIETGDTIELNTRSDYREIKFTPKRFADEKTETLRFSFTRPTTTTPFNFNSPRIAFELKMHSGWDFWLQVLLTTTFWVGSTLLIGIDYTKVTPPLTWQSVVAFLTYWKIGASILNAVILIWMFRLWGGKKPS